MTHAIITGSAGFIGRHLCRHLLERTDWVITAMHGNTYADDLAEMCHGPRCRLVSHDLRIPIDIELARHLEEPGPVDYIVNLASASHVDRSIAEPAIFVKNNVDLALHMLEYARRCKPRTFVQFSTDEVFGPAAPGVFHEEDDVHCPSNPYSASKSSQENLAIAWWRTYGVPVMTTRTMNNYASDQHSEKFVPLVVSKLMAGKSIPVHADYVDDRWHSGSRTWLHADSTADAIRFLLETVTPPRYPETDRPFACHISGDVELSNLGIVMEAARILNMPPVFHFVDVHSARPGHDRRYALSGKKLHDLGWRMPLSFAEAFRRTVLELAERFRTRSK
jgi:dTDP-glucose 4,6-dehydratase